MNEFVRIDTCQICESSVKPEIIVSIDESNKKSYLDYSEIKYDGLIDDWLSDKTTL